MTFLSYPIPEAGAELLLADDERLDQFSTVVEGKRYGEPLRIFKDVSVDGSPWLTLHGPSDFRCELGYRTPPGLCIDISPDWLQGSEVVPLEQIDGRFIGFLVPRGVARPAGVGVLEAQTP